MEKIKGYKRRLEKRRRLARRFGKAGTYRITEGQNKSKTLPKPLPVLASMIKKGEERE